MILYLYRKLLYSHIRGAFGKFLAFSFFLSNRFTNPIIIKTFGIILKSYFSSLLWHNYNADTKTIIVNTCSVCILERKISVAIITFHLLKSVQNIKIVHEIR